MPAKKKTTRRYKHQYRHKITFQSPDPETAENKAVIMAFGGAHTSAIAEALGLSVSAAQYRVIKGLGKGMRQAFRDGTSKYFYVAQNAIRDEVMREHVQKKVAPLFAPPRLPS